MDYEKIAQIVDFKVSVVIPAYNSAFFLVKAVQSALSLPDVGEVIVVDDGSTDNTFELCMELIKYSNKLRILQHPDKMNHGVSASRNLGIMNSSYPYVAFLDSDDYYLPNRFKKAREIFSGDDLVDGVYDAAQYEDDFIIRNNNLYSITESLIPSDLFYWMLSGKKGFFCTNAITIKKRLFNKSGMFLESIRMHEDTELWLRLAYYGTLVAGDLNNPVAIIRRHSTNAIKTRSHKTLLRLYEIIFDYYLNRNLSQEQRKMLHYGYWRSRSLSFNNIVIRRVYFYFFFLRDLVRLNLRLNS